MEAAGAVEVARLQDRSYDELKRERDKKLDEIIRLFDQARAYAKAGKDKTR